MMIYPWGHKKRYNDYSSYSKKKYNGRVQKISVNLGLTCPNRDGTKGTDGCIYCNNKTFSPFYCHDQNNSLQQLDKGIKFFSEKYKTQEYLVYFQSYTNTYGKTEILVQEYKKVLSTKGVKGIVIATRPDCISEEMLKELQEINKEHEVIIEYGIESTRNRTLELINRCHTYDDAIDAIKLTKKYNIDCGIHMIFGLPGEDKNDILDHAERISKLPIKTLKIHQLQIIKGSKAELLFAESPELFMELTVVNYIDLVVHFLERLNPNIIVERFISESPKEMIISPKWGGIKNFEIVAKIEKRLKELDTWQGKQYKNQ